MNNTETLKEEIVYFNEQTVYKNGDFIITRKDRNIDCTNCEPIFGEIPKSFVQNLFVLHKAEKFICSHSASDLHLLGDDKTKEGVEESINILRKHYERYGVNGRPKKIKEWTDENGVNWDLRSDGSVLFTAFHGRTDGEPLSDELKKVNEYTKLNWDKIQEYRNWLKAELKDLTNEQRIVYIDNMSQ